MFSNAYQNGPILEIWDARGSWFSTQSIPTNTHSIDN